MPVPNDILFNQYGGPPKVPAQTAKPLARLLRNQAPSDLSVNESAQLDEIESLAASIDEALKQRETVGGVRPTWLDFVNAWSATHAALDAMRRIPRSLSPKAELAEVLFGIVFQDGLAFTQLRAPQAWAAGDRLVARISEDGLTGRIEELIGTEHLSAAQRATVALGEVIGAGTTPIEIPDPTAVQGLLSKFQRAVGRYGRVMAASVVDDDPTSVERFRRAVALPIDRYRSTSSERDADPTDPALEPTDPGPSDPTV